MNKLRKALALVLSLAAILCFPISASALSDEALPTAHHRLCPHRLGGHI